MQSTMPDSAGNSPFMAASKSACPVVLKKRTLPNYVPSATRAFNRFCCG
jgi:hypothetical protein